MRIKYFVGAVGGRPNFAYYFVGTMFNLNQQKSQGKNYEIIYLDPHLVQNKPIDME